MPDALGANVVEKAAPLTPTMQKLVDRMRRVHTPPFYAVGAAQARALYARSAGVLEVAPPAMAKVRDLTIPVRDGASIGARFFAPEVKRGLPLLLFMHGGGFTIGSPATHDVLCRELARAGGVAVLSLDYRLAPEHRFPTAVFDVWDALQWVRTHGARELSVDVERVAVGGDSSGGTLAAVAAIHARDVGIPLTLQLLIYPGATALQDTPSHRVYADSPVLSKRQIDWFFNNYIARDQRLDWRFAPLLADDLEGVASAWLGLAECDALVDEGVLYGDKLRAAGVEVDLEIYRGVVHGFAQMSRVLPEARQLQRAAGAALAAAFARGAGKV